MNLSRRGALATGIGSLMFAPWIGGAAQRPRTSLGLCQYCGRFARQLARQENASHDLFRPENFFQYARALGAGGYQVELGILTPQRAAVLRDQAEAAGMYIEGIVRAPKQKSDVARFDEEMKSAAAIGARAVRSTIFSGRRYEVFDSLEAYRTHDARAMRSLELAAPIAEKYRVGFAPENHKDHRISERVAALKKIDSEFVGACVDTGNNFALLEDPVETAKALAPWAHAVHLKDQAVQMTDQGFLFGDIPLGEGFVDLKQIVDILQTARPEIHFTLELLTRDPLNVPCLEPKYWRTFPDLPASDLARTLRIVRDNRAVSLQYPSRLTLQKKVSLEADNVKKSIAYARDHLGLVA